MMKSKRTKYEDMRIVNNNNMKIVNNLLTIRLRTYLKKIQLLNWFEHRFLWRKHKANKKVSQNI